jgi:fatty acid desaturase (delta-4 desaturase)
MCVGERLSLTTDQLLKRPDLVAVDGVLYDIVGLAKAHPGGDLIQASGAADASALFHSMHPGTKPENSKLLQEFIRGEHVRDSKTDPVYAYDTDFAKDVRKSVREVMKGVNWYAPMGFWIRTAVIMALTVVGEWYWMTTGMLMWAMFTGFMHMQIGLSIQHDASHGAISKRPWVNALFAYGIDCIGSSRWIWLQSHIMRHHPYTNHQGLDLDAGSAEPFILFHDYPAASQNRKWYHRFQAFYLHAILAFYGLSMTYNPYYLFRMQHNDTIPNSTTALAKDGFLRQYRAYAVAMRLFFIFRTAVMPWYLCGVNPLIAIPIVPTFTGIFLTFVFVVSHNFEGSEREPAKKCLAKASEAEKKSGDDSTAQDDKIDWYQAQAETSCTYGGMGGMIFTGGLNMQIEHHLFPRMSSWHYPRIQKTVQEVCERHGVRYAYYPTLWDNVISTLKYMNKVGIAQTLAHAQAELS